MNKPRHEIKHEIPYLTYEAMRRRAAAVLRRDAHAGENGLYRVHSLYFDNFCDKALREKMDGINHREKFRIRYYNDDLSRIVLEKKCKDNGLCTKYAAPMTADEVRRLLAGETGWMAASPHGLVRELYCKMQTQLLRPRQAVDYVREPFVYGPGNVRVTFDREISSGPADERFLDPHAAVPAGHAGAVVLEVKFDAFLPAVVAGLLGDSGCRPGAYSKYAACRRAF